MIFLPIEGHFAFGGLRGHWGTFPPELTRLCGSIEPEWKSLPFAALSPCSREPRV